MSNLVVFDQKGAIGPATTLLFNINNYNPAGVEKLSQYVAAQFEKMSGMKAEGQKELCDLVITKTASNSPLTITETINTLFFQTMQWKGALPAYHSKVQDEIVPNSIKFIQKMLPDTELSNEEEALFSSWLAKFMLTYMSENDIATMYKKGQEKEAQFREERAEIGKTIYQLVQTGDFVEDDLDRLLAVCKSALPILNEAPHPKVSLDLTGRYLKLFSLGDSSLSTDVTLKLDGIFRKKFFTPNEKEADAVATSAEGT